ncbi:YjbD family protein [Vibrio chagasii]|nr:YjbD family protein [Vibrio chagasii]
MQLERIEISGTRGIKRMSLAFDELTTLIGEKWQGKVFTIRCPFRRSALRRCLYHFEMTRFMSITQFHIHSLNIFPNCLSLKANDKSELNTSRYRKLKPIWVQDEFGVYQEFITGVATLEQYETTTHYAFF